MPEPVPQLAAITLLTLVALTTLSVSVVSAARDADWWVIARGILRGRYERYLRPLASRRGR